MNKFWVKAIAFVVIIGLLIILGSREMKKRGINQKNFSPEDVTDIYESYNVIGSVDYIEIEIADSAADTDGYSYKAPLGITDKNEISLLRNELNNSEELGKDEAKTVGDYFACSRVTFHLKNGEKLYCGIDSNLINSGMFFVSKTDFYEDRTNYKVLSGDDISKQVIDLYNKYSRLAPAEDSETKGNVVSLDDFLSESNTNTTANTSNITNSNTANTKQ